MIERLIQMLERVVTDMQPGDDDDWTTYREVCLLAKEAREWQGVIAGTNPVGHIHSYKRTDDGYYICECGKECP